MKLFKNLLYLGLVMPLVFTACDDDDDNGPEPPGGGEEEVITTVSVVLTDGTTTQTISSVDLDGPGGTDAVPTGATLQANTRYSYTATFLNQTEDPVENVTEEILEEDEEHQIFWDFGSLGGTLNYTDADDEGRPIGVTGTITTGDPGTGEYTLTLRHEPEKDAAGVADGDIANANGETDVEARFPITIE